MLTSGITETLDIPHEQGQTITIRKLSWKQLQDARDARQQNVFKMMRDMGKDMLPDMSERCRKGCGEEKHKGACPPPEEWSDPSAADPAEAYDTELLLRTAITAWTYDGPVSDKAVNDLDEPTIKWLKAEIVRFNTTPSEEEQGN